MKIPASILTWVVAVVWSFSGVALHAAAVEPVAKYGDSIFRPGALWLDDHGTNINAHGGGLLFVPGDWLRRGTYYWFGEHKVAGEAGNTAQVGVHVYSSHNLTTWKDEGIAFKVSDDPQSEIFRGSVIERPKVIFNRRTKKFVMWFHLELVGQSYSAARSGVAIADRVTGPYTYLGSFRPNAETWPMNVPAESKHSLGPEDATALKSILPNDGYYETYPTNLVYRRDFAQGQMARDMTLFVDDDGVAYQIYASEKNGTLQISQLTDDYLKPAGRYIRIFSRGYHEAPALFKAGGRYFMFSSHCTGWAPNAGRLSVADSIWGPWQELANPWRGPSEKTSVSFGTQSTFVIPVQGHPGAFIFMADLWRPENPIDGRYVWLPIRWEAGLPVLDWQDDWKMSVFKRLEFRQLPNGGRVGNSL